MSDRINRLTLFCSESHSKIYVVNTQEFISRGCSIPFECVIVYLSVIKLTLLMGLHSFLSLQFALFRWNLWLFHELMWLHCTMRLPLKNVTGQHFDPFLSCGFSCIFLKEPACAADWPFSCVAFAVWVSGLLTKALRKINIPVGGPLYHCHYK